MTYPASVVTRPVQVGGAISVEEGRALSIDVETVASRSLVHQATGTRMEKLAFKMASWEVGEPIWWEIAATDQSNTYLDAETRQAIVLGPDEHTHLYTTTLRILDGVEQVAQYVIGPYPVPSGSSMLDLDTHLIPDGTAEGTLVAIPETWAAIIADADAIVGMRGTPNGLATLDGAGIVPTEQLPEFALDADVAADFAALPSTLVSQAATGIIVPADATITAIQAAFDSAATFGTRVVAAGTVTTDVPLTVSTSCDLTGLTLNHTGASTPAIVVTGSNVVIDGVTLIGPGNTTLSNSRGVQAIGTVADPLRNVTVRNAKISGFRQVGVWLQHVDGFTIENSLIFDCQYAGILCMSVFHGVISGNRIDHITGTPLAYGITISKASEPLSTAPRSTDVTITGNVVTDVPNWEGIDTHGGERITIASNTVSGCMIGIAVVPAKDAAAVDEIFAPLSVAVVGNTIDSLKLNGTARFGISFTGAYQGPVGSVYQYATGVISGNVIKNHGDPTFDNQGAMYIHSTRGVVVTGNQLINPSALGINVHHDNQDITVIGNTITEVWATTSAECAAIMVRLEYNTATIAGNRLAVNGEHSDAPKVNVWGLRVMTSANNEIVAYGNQFTRATNPISGALALRSQFMAAAPAAIGAALSPANTSTVDATYGTEERDVINNTRARVNSIATLLQSLGLLT